MRTSDNLCHECGGHDPRCDWCKGTGDEVRGALELLADLASTPSDRLGKGPEWAE